MSLYGTGRSEGIGAVLLIGAIVLLVRAIAAWPTDIDELLLGLQPALLPALGGMLCYRFLRAQGRSRYAGFLVGAAYGLSPWLLSIASVPREQLAAALAPLALEAACRCDRPSWRARWLPWSWFCIALPFLAGLTVIGVLTSLLCAAAFVRTLTCGDRDDERPAGPGFLLAAIAAIAAIGNLVWLDPLGAWLGPLEAMSPMAVLSTHRPQLLGFDVAAVLRVPGPVLLTFAALGLLRRQRHVDSSVWLGLALAGGLPTLIAGIPLLHAASPLWMASPLLPAAAWWLSLLAIAVLGAAGLDDFLGLPMRRRTALPWLLAIAVAVSPLIPAFGARAPEREWPLTVTFLALTVLLPTWRRLGILSFKNWLAAAVLVTLAIPALQVIPLPTASPAAPLGEFAPPGPRVEVPMAPPLWHYSGLLAACVCGGWLWLSAAARKRHARPQPIAAKAAIKKKPKPAKRS